MCGHYGYIYRVMVFKSKHHKESHSSISFAREIDTRWIYEDGVEWGCNCGACGECTTSDRNTVYTVEVIRACKDSITYVRAVKNSVERARG